MKQISFMKRGLELHATYVNAHHRTGDPLPVMLVKAALQNWKNHMGWDDDRHTAPNVAWDQVRVGAQIFSADQYLRAEKTATQTPAETFADSARNTPPKEAPKTFKVPDTIPDWGLVEMKSETPKPGISSGTISNDTTLPKEMTQNDDGSIDYHATNEAHLQEELRRIGAKPRTPKP